MWTLSAVHRLTCYTSKKPFVQLQERFCTVPPPALSSQDERGYTKVDSVKQKLREAQKRYALKNNDIIKQRQKAYRLKNKELIKEKQKKYILKNKQMISEQQKEYRSNNKEFVREINKSYKRKNKEAIKEQQKEYRRKNMEVIKKQQKEYKQKRKLSFVRKYPDWKSPSEVRNYFEKLKEKLHIRDKDDWYRISRPQIRGHEGSGVYHTHKTLGDALQFAYPEITWDMKRFSFSGKKSTQRWLRVMLEKILPEKCDVFEDFLHPDLVWNIKNNLKMELDLWIPRYKLALEYQGEQHYHDIHTAFGPSGTMALYSERDLKKKKACAENGITLVIIPYWWTGTQESLAATLHLIRPDVFPKIEGALPIPVDPPSYSTKKVDPRIEVSLMHGREWSEEKDPTGWFISEKLDGVRAFWDGKELLTRQGKIIPAPDSFIQNLPRDIALDGELWAGYQAFYKILSIVGKSHKLIDDQKKLEEAWEGVKYCVFDAPKCGGNYETRHAFAQKHIHGSPNLEMIPYVVCLGPRDLQDKLQEVRLRKGEGLMLYEPTADYTPGRTDRVLKVKAYTEEEVKFIKRNTKSYTFVCEHQNGSQSVVKCSGWDYTNPPEEGTILKVKHMGIHQKSKKMKYPFLINNIAVNNK